MSATATALIGLIMWSVVLTFVLLFARVGAVLKGEKALNNFDPGGSDLAPSGYRITRAHGNSLEYLALPVGMLLFAIFSDQEAVTNGTALIYLGCRAAQSISHIISTAVPMVMVRATLFTVQIVLLIYWAINLT